MKMNCSQWIFKFRNHDILNSIKKKVQKKDKKETKKI